MPHGIPESERCDVVLDGVEGSGRITLIICHVSYVPCHLRQGFAAFERIVSDACDAAAYADAYGRWVEYLEKL